MKCDVDSVCSFRLRRALNRQDYGGRVVADGFSTFEPDVPEGHFISEILARIKHVSPTWHAFALD
jgi:hypothetical protein